MKAIIKKIALILIAILLSVAGTDAQNKEIKSIVKKYKSSMPPYKYESYAVKKIVYGSKEKSEVLEFAIYSNEDYKLVFCKTEFSHPIDINIYDRNPKEKGRKLIYFDESEKKSSCVFNFKPNKAGSYFVELKIPPATAQNQEEYIILLIGIKENQGFQAAK